MDEQRQAEQDFFMVFHSQAAVCREQAATRKKFGLE